MLGNFLYILFVLKCVNSDFCWRLKLVIKELKKRISYPSSKFKWNSWFICNLGSFYFQCLLERWEPLLRLLAVSSKQFAQLHGELRWTEFYCQLPIMLENYQALGSAIFFSSFADKCYSPLSDDLGQALTITIMAVPSKQSHCNLFAFMSTLRSVLRIKIEMRKSNAFYFEVES